MKEEGGGDGGGEGGGDGGGDTPYLCPAQCSDQRLPGWKLIYKRVSAEWL